VQNFNAIIDLEKPKNEEIYTSTTIRIILMWLKIWLVFGKVTIIVIHIKNITTKMDIRVVEMIKKIRCLSGVILWVECSYCFRFLVNGGCFKYMWKRIKKIMLKTGLISKSFSVVTSSAVLRKRLFLASRLLCSFQLKFRILE
jgi:hypothetical protein